MISTRGVTQRRGARVFVESLGAMQMAAEIGIPFEVGPHLPVTNRLALDEVARMGAVRVWLSPELSLDQIRELSRDTPVELGIFISGAQELMITEHWLAHESGPVQRGLQPSAAAVAARIT